MGKFISFEKLSKKKQRELNAKKRGSWYGLNPVTRKPENSKVYNRQKARKWSDDSMAVPFAMSAGKSPIWVSFFCAICRLEWTGRLASTSVALKRTML